MIIILTDSMIHSTMVTEGKSSADQDKDVLTNLKSYIGFEDKIGEIIEEGRKEGRKEGKKMFCQRR